MDQTFRRRSRIDACVVLLGTLSAAFLLITEAASKERLTVEKMLLLDRVGNIALSNTGDQIAYTVEIPDPANYVTHQDLYVAPSGNLRRARRILAAEHGVSRVQWASDGRSLYYLSSNSGTRQLWNVAADSGARRQVTDFPLDIITFQLADRDRVLVTAHEVFPECLDLECTRARIEQEQHRGDTGRLYKDGEAPRFMDRYRDGRYVNLFTSVLSGSSAVTRSVPITHGYRYDILETAFGLQQDFSVSADGQWVYFAARPSGSNQGDEWPKALYRTETAVSERVSVITQDAGLSLSSPRLSPDGRRLAYLKAEGTAYTAPRMAVWVRDLLTQEERPIGGNLDSVLSQVYLNDLQWSPDGTVLYATGPDQGQTRLFSLPADGTARFERLPADGSVAGYTVGAGRLAYLHSRWTQSPEIAVIDSAMPRRMVSRSAFRAAGSDRFELGEVTALTFIGWNGEPVQGFVMKPAGFKPGRRYPVILQMHGGPNEPFSDQWTVGPTSPQLFAARGYVVVMINPHGSAGYGTAFGRAVLGHWSDRPLADFKAGWAQVLQANRFIDANRACAMGASYGGYLALLFAGQWSDPWKCLFAGSPIFDIHSFFYSSDIAAYSQRSFSAQPWKDDSDEQRSPITQVANWRVPLFIVSGTDDYRVPNDQSIGAYGAARRMKVPAQLLVFEGEAHGVRRPQNVVRFIAETMQWFDRWTDPQSTQPHDP